MDITPILVQTIELIVAIGIIIVIPRLRSWLHANTTEKQRKEMLEWVEIAVNAAEQMMKAGLLPEIPKKDWVLEFLATKNLTASIPELETAIEAAVKRLNGLNQ